MLSGSYIVASLIWLFLSTDPADSVPWRSLLSVGLSEGCGFDPRREWHIIVVSSRGAMVARQTSMLWACHLSSFFYLGSRLYALFLGNNSILSASYGGL